MNDYAPPIVDFDIVRANTLGDEGFERSLLEAFLEDNEERMKIVRAALESSDGDVVGLEAHSLKGAAATLGAQALADAARDLESAVAEGSLDDAQRRFAEVKRELARVCEVLEERLRAL